MKNKESQNGAIHSYEEKEKALSSISRGSFITVVCILLSVLLLSGALSYFIPAGSFERDESGAIIPDTYQSEGVKGIAIWRVITAPVRVFWSEDALTVIFISLFLLIMSGVFNLLDKTGGIRVFIGRIIRKLADRGGPVVCISALIFMLFGSFFGMFEELVTLLPVVIMFVLSLGMDSMTGLGACILASCFGFSAAITNPFSVGLAAQIAGIGAMDGVWLRILFFGVVYGILVAFLMLHLKRIERNPSLSPTFEADIKRREALKLDAGNAGSASNDRIFKVFLVFFSVQTVLLVLIASIRAISSLAIPLLSVSFLVGGIVAGLFVTDKKSDIFRYLLKGAVAMLPAVIMIAIASSVKLVMTESGIIDTVTSFFINLLDGKGKLVTVLLIYVLILFLQVFIGSASAKILLIMPIILPICTALDISAPLVILTYCMADGFTDVILPTNPVLLVGISMANVSYGKWVKWTWKLQLVILAATVLTLTLACGIGY